VKQYNITLINTSRYEHGKCNADELLDILKAVKPDVIFEEIPAHKFNAFYVDKTINNMQSMAIIMYKESHIIEPIPVDNYEFPEISKKKVDSLFSTIKKKNTQYRELMETYYKMTYLYGFEYINSIECINYFTKAKLLEMEVLLKLKNKKLLELYTLFYDIQNERENVMLGSIYDYYDINKFNNAVFLVGAAHRNSIIQKIENFNAAGYKLKWNLYFFGRDN